MSTSIWVLILIIYNMTWYDMTWYVLYVHTMNSLLFTCTYSALFRWPLLFLQDTESCDIAELVALIPRNARLSRGSRRLLPVVFAWLAGRARLPLGVAGVFPDKDRESWEVGGEYVGSWYVLMVLFCWYWLIFQETWTFTIQSKTFVRVFFVLSLFVLIPLCPKIRLQRGACTQH